MAKLKLPTKHRGLIVGTIVVGGGVAGYMIIRNRKNAEAAAAAANAAQTTSDQSGAISDGYPDGYYDNGSAYGPGGYGGGNTYYYSSDNDDDTTTTTHKNRRDHDERMPALEGQTLIGADAELGRHGFHEIQTRGHGNIVKSQFPHAGARVDPDSTPVVLHLGRK